MVFHRAVLAGMLSFIVIGDWTLKIFTLVIAILFAVSELYPERYLRLLGTRKVKGERVPGESLTGRYTRLLEKRRTGGKPKP